MPIGEYTFALDILTNKTVRCIMHWSTYILNVYCFIQEVHSSLSTLSTFKHDLLTLCTGLCERGKKICMYVTRGNKRQLPYVLGRVKTKKKTGILWLLPPSRPQALWCLRLGLPSKATMQYILDIVGILASYCKMPTVVVTNKTVSFLGYTWELILSSRFRSNDVLTSEWVIIKLYLWHHCAKVG